MLQHTVVELLKDLSVHLLQRLDDALRLDDVVGDGEARQTAEAALLEHLPQQH